MKATARAPVAGLLLTGGRSRRMGFDKALLMVDGQPNAVRLAGVLRRVAAGPLLEVGPGRSGLPSVEEERPGEGPLVALAAGSRALAGLGWHGASLLLACDLPRLSAEVLAVLAAWPSEGSVVPLLAGAPQPLCARWSPSDLEVARRLAAQGRRAMQDLLAETGPVLLRPGEWLGPGDAEMRAEVLADVDSPADVERLGLSGPASPRPPQASGEGLAE